MIIDHPLLGPRDASEFIYLGDAALIDRPDPEAEDAAARFHDYLYLRDNPAGLHRELWFHEQGDRSWLVVTRDTVTHEILKVEFARDVARARGRGKPAHEGPSVGTPVAANDDGARQPTDKVVGAGGQ